MDLIILTPEEEFFKGQVTSVKVPGISGQFEILENHAPIVAALSNGQVRVDKSDGQQIMFSIHKGFVEVLNNEVSLLVQGLSQDEA